MYNSNLVSEKLRRKFFFKMFANYIKDGDFLALRGIINFPPSYINLVDDHGNSLGHLAIRSRNERALDYLLTNGLDLYHVNSLHETLGAEAVIFNHLPSLKVLNKYNYPLDENYNGFTLLHLCMYDDNTSDIIRFLLNAGLSPDVMGPHGVTPLMLAASKDNYEVIKTLILNFAEIDLQDDFGNTALHYSILSRAISSMNLLLANGANQNIVNADGLRPIDLLNQ